MKGLLSARGSFMTGFIAVLLAGCSQSESVVVVKDTDGEEISYNVQSSANEECDMGVRRLRNEQYDVAIKHFDRAIAEDPKDWRAWFGKGLAQENLGDLDAARKSYEEANALTSEPQPDVDESRRRVKTKQDGGSEQSAEEATPH